MKLFISYRRADSRETSGRIYDRLAQTFGKESIFMDLVIPKGSHFVAVIERAVLDSKIMLVIIGDQWLTVQDKDGRRRLDDPADFVRMEVEMSLRHGLRVIPVLVNGANMPAEAALPSRMAQMVFRNAATIRESHFDADVNALIESLYEDMIGSQSPAPPTPTLNVYQLIELYKTHFTAKAWDEARETLAKIAAQPKVPLIFNIQVQETRLWTAMHTDERDQAYAYLRTCVQRREWVDFWEGLEGLWNEHRGYDPDGLIEQAARQSHFSVYAPTLKRLDVPLPSRVRHILPTPFDWVYIPAGKVTLVNTWDDDASLYLKKDVPQTFTVPAFKIAKYPVTNAQFAAFIKAGGYKTQKWWTADGWQTRESGQWTEPRSWTDANFNGGTQPVVSVSWYESVAFCQWLSDVTGEKIMLPTEDQWQYAAQGDDNRVYPWSNEWDGNRCNNNVDGSKGIGKTTPVRQYEGKGDSPFGVVDMAGNVWEWCVTDYANRTNDINMSSEYRVLRGGSWGSNHTGVVRCDYRYWDIPHSRVNNRGFRCCALS